MILRVHKLQKDGRWVIQRQTSPKMEWRRCAKTVSYIDKTTANKGLIRYRKSYDRDDPHAQAMRLMASMPFCKGVVQR